MSKQNDIIIYPRIRSRAFPSASLHHDQSHNDDKPQKLRPHYANLDLIAQAQDKSGSPARRSDLSRANAESVSSGNFGHLIRAVNQKNSTDRELTRSQDRQIKLNLYQVGPENLFLSEDRCTLWKDHSF